MAIIPFHIVDAFAERPFTGNPAAIIPNASCLTEPEMMQITDELSMEAGFVLPPEHAGADVRLRFFTHRREANLSGHVLIAAFASMADRGFYKPTPEGQLIRVETGAGILPVTLTAGRDGTTRITVRLPGPRFGEPVPAEEVALALDVDPLVLRYNGHGPQRVSCGFDEILVPVDSRELMRGEIRNIQAISELTDRRGVGGLTLVCADTFSSESDLHCRFFHPRVGADEDVASGTSLGAAAAFAVQIGMVTGMNGDLDLTTEQGQALGRPTLARLRVRSKGSTVTAVDLTATGAVVMRGSFHFTRQARMEAY